MAVLAHARKRLSAISENQPCPERVQNLSARRSPAVAFGIDRVMLAIGRIARHKGYGRVGLRASLAAARMNPALAQANISAGVALERIGDGAGARFYLRRAAAAEDASKRGSWELAKLLLREMRNTMPNAVRPELLTTLRQASISTDGVIRHAALLALSNLLLEEGEYGAAETTADAALVTSPEDIHSLRAKANSIVPQNRFTEASVLYSRMVAREPRNEEISRRLRLLTQLAEEEAPVRHSPAVVRNTKEPLLIGVGSGIGDILHATPMIRNIAQRSGARVEIVVAADHSYSEFLVENPSFVSRVWPLSRALLERPFEKVFLTQFFGPLRFEFQADCVLKSSDWHKFRAGMLNDTLLNLEAAKHLLGIPYDDTDALHYFVGDLRWHPPAEPLIGIHAGSKSGRWLSKRWPYFAELTARLLARGLRVASFGTPDEYVPGTENRTGGTIEEMSRAMVACSHFLSNDSGAMHIASALGMPVVALYGPTDALSHLPLQPSTNALVLNKGCSPCEVKDHRHFASGRCRCIGEISIDVVEAKLVEIISHSHKSSLRVSEGVA